MEQTYAVGRMEEMIEHFKPVTIKQMRETYYFWNAQADITVIRYKEQDDEGRNLYEEVVS